MSRQFSEKRTKFYTLTVALAFALDQLKEGLIPTLFVISCQNYERFNGMVMDNEAYSAYPNEAEVLLTDGCDMYVL